MHHAEPQHGTVPAATHPTPAPADGEEQLACAHCGAVPAVNATFRGHLGFIVILKYLKRQGPFCRTCGIATHREMTSDSLWQGWWGIPSMIVNPIIMLLNVPQRLKVNKLPEPAPGAPGPSMDPGKPVYLRPVIFGVLIPVVLGSILFLTLKDDPGFAEAGDCIHNNSPLVFPGAVNQNADVKIVPCSGPDAEARVVARKDDTVDGESACRAFPEADGYFTYERRDTKYTLCLKTIKQRPVPILTPR
ncbi:hypothetical protein [Kitasatospora sp. NPDC101183]|uniref:LppU/SCO3897 family protein n=1 Tax=Kitasatospora sp. NPDC101183 TaxID=3364100 RepID=UPI0038140925